MAQRWKQLRVVIVVFAVLAVGVALATHFSLLDSVRAADATSAAPATSPKPANAADEKAIRATAEDFLTAFNAGDAKAVGALWASDAEYTDESGKSYQGRAAIEKEYADFFKEHHGATMTVTIESVRFLGPDIAVEKGIAKVKLPSADAPLGSRYTVVHARRDGKWIMVVGRDAPYVPGSNEDYLKDLEWVIGDWAIDGKDRPLRLHFEWMAQRNFIKNTYIATKDGKETLTGGQIIGWNPKLGASFPGILMRTAASATTCGPRTARSGSSRRRACFATAAKARR